MSAYQSIAATVPADGRPRRKRSPSFGVMRGSLCAMLIAGVWAPVTAAQSSAATAAREPSEESLAKWQWFRGIPLPAADTAADASAPNGAQRVDLVIPPEVFSDAARELDDLRVLTASGETVPYALRVRREQWGQQDVPSEIFNRSLGPEQARELSLDLGAAPIEHNEIEVRVAGDNVRRRATLEGSPDGDAWRLLADDFLLHFVRGDDEFQHLHLSYPPSRFRFLRLRVYPDPVVDEEPVEIESVNVRRRVAIPGEDLVQPAAMGPREPTREAGAPGSAWILELGGDRVPVERIEVETSEADFVRDYVVEYAGPEGPRARFQPLAAGTWQRRAGEPPEPLVAEFREVPASRLRLIVIDHSNPPLNVASVRFAAPARQVVFERPPTVNDPLRLYYGNPEAIAPRYDFARNLPDALNPPPVRTTLGPPQANPVHVPDPVPVTERWPAMIYVVLGIVSVVLALLILSVARTTIAWHDAESPGAPAS